MGEGKGSREESELVPGLLRHWLIGRVLVAGLALGCYANSCWGDFVFDDSEAVINNQDVDPGATSLADVFSHDFWGTNISSRTSHKSYRPLTVLSFRLSFWLGGGRNPFHFHLANVLLHPLVCLLLLEVLNNWFCQLKTSSKPVSRVDWRAPICSSEALVATLLFAVHPIHTESVSGVVGRAELASALFFFSSILAYPSPTSQGGRAVEILRLLLTLVLAGSAMLFKEQGITALGVCTVSDVLFRAKKLQKESGGQAKCRSLPWSYWRQWCDGGSGRKLCLRSAVLCVGGAGLVWGRFAVMTTGAPQFKPIDNPASFSDSWTTKILSYNYLYSLNWWLLYHPWWLCFDWSMGCVPLVQSATDLRVAAVAVFWAGLGALAFRGLSRFHTGDGRLVILSLSLVVLPFLPASNLFFTVGFVVAERVLYLSTAGHCLLVAIGAAYIGAFSSLTKRVVQVFLVYLTVFLALRSVHRSSQWLNEESLFISGLHVCPLNAKVHVCNVTPPRFA
ncbi:Protein O-mannosyl-transferase TMTC4, partial [Geodia barretti]